MKKTESEFQKDRPIVLFDIDYTLFNTAHLKSTQLAEFRLYDEVIDVLKKLSPAATLGILSEGKEEWQLRKLKETEIHDIFEEEHTHIVEDKFEVAEKTLERYKKVKKIFLVDDKLTFLYRAKKILPQLCSIWIKRGMYAMNQDPIGEFTPDYTVDTLQEIIPIILYE